VADVMRTCANCGNAQASGDFCEKCGTRMPAPPPPSAAPAYSAAQAPSPGAAPPPPYGAQPPYGTTPSAAPQYGYPAGGERYRTHSEGPFAFVGSMKRSTFKLLWWIVLGLIGLYVLFNIIEVAIVGGKVAVIAFFASLFFAGFLFVVSWVLFEGVGLALRRRDKEDGR
jgi:hypothetical protein